MEPIEIIFQRRSIRNFTPQPVTRGEIEILLKAGMAAPSAVNSQPWEFIVVNDPETLKKLKRVSLFSNRNAPLAVVVLGSPQKAGNPAGLKFWIQDCSAAMQNILLAAVSLGLGGVWIGIHPIQGVEEKVRELLAVPAECGIHPAWHGAHRPPGGAEEPKHPIQTEKSVLAEVWQSAARRN